MTRSDQGRVEKKQVKDGSRTGRGEEDHQRSGSSPVKSGSKSSAVSRVWTVQPVVGRALCDGVPDCF